MNSQLGENWHRQIISHKEKRKKLDLTKWWKLQKDSRKGRLTFVITSCVSQINGKHFWKIVDKRAKSLQQHLDCKLNLAKVQRGLSPPQNCCTGWVNGVAAQSLAPFFCYDRFILTNTLIPRMHSFWLHCGFVLSSTLHTRSFSEAVRFTRTVLLIYTDFIDLVIFLRFFVPLPWVSRLHS